MDIAELITEVDKPIESKKLFHVVECKQYSDSTRSPKITCFSLHPEELQKIVQFIDDEVCNLV